MALIYIDVDLTSTSGGWKGIGNSDYTTRQRYFRVNFYIHDVTPCIVGIFFKSIIDFLNKYIFRYCLIMLYITHS